MYGVLLRELLKKWKFLSTHYFHPRPRNEKLSRSSTCSLSKWNFHSKKSDLRHQFYQECQFSWRNWVLSVWKPGSDWLLIKIYKRHGAPHFPTIFMGSTWLSKSLSACAERCRPGNWFTALSAAPISHSHNTHGAARAPSGSILFSSRSARI